MTAAASLLWLVNVAADTAGQTAFKAAATLPDGPRRWRRMAVRPWLWIGLACFVAEGLAWLAFLSLVPLSEGVMLGSINIVAVMLAGRLCFAEALSARRVGGILLIATGVAIVGLG